MNKPDNNLDDSAKIEIKKLWEDVSKWDDYKPETEVKLCKIEDPDCVACQ